MICSKNTISSDSDSSEDEENSGNKVSNEDKKQQAGEKETEEEMDVDPGSSLWIISFIQIKYSTSFFISYQYVIFLEEVTCLIADLKNSDFLFPFFFHKQFLSTF